MKHYLESLQRLQNTGIEAIAPGHGVLLNEAETAIRWIIDHRLEREKKIIDALEANPGSTAKELVPGVYREVEQHLHKLAERSLLAHLIKLDQESRATISGGRWTMAKVR
jgi:hypothetical protein